MNPEERETIRKAIVAGIKGCNEEVNGLVEWIQPVAPDRAIGRLTRMEAIQQKNMHEANLRNAQQKKRQLEAALELLEDPDYGECGKCGKPIPFKRLLLVPHGRICVRCMRRR